MLTRGGRFGIIDRRSQKGRAENLEKTIQHQRTKERKVKKQSQRISRKKKEKTAEAEKIFFREFDPGSGRTLAACLTHASRTKLH